MCKTMLRMRSPHKRSDTTLYSIVFDRSEVFYILYAGDLNSN